MILALPKLSRTLDYGQPVNRLSSLNRGLKSWILWTPLRGRGRYAYDLASRSTGMLLSTAGPTWYGSRGRKNGNGSLQFDGTDDNVRSTAMPVTAMPLTLSCWVYTNSSATNQCAVYAGNGSAAEGWCAILMRSTGVFSAYYNSNSDQNVFADGAAYAANRWYHVVCVFTSTASRQCFVDGVAGTEETTSVNTATINRFSLGSIDRSTPLYFLNGHIDDIRLYDRALSTNEVVALYRESCAGHPTTLNWRQPYITGYAAAAGGAVVPVMYRQRQMQGMAS